jgi:hypothetical protein
MMENPKHPSLRTKTGNKKYLPKQGCLYSEIKTIDFAGEFLSSLLNNGKYHQD